MPQSAVEAALRYVESHVERTKSRLAELVRIPSVSAEGFPREEVRRSAEATAALLREAGLENVRLLEMPGQHPYAYGDWLHAQGGPTLLVYGHHDVQPPGRPERWTTPAFEPAERDGRLYGRGTVDDKGTFICQIAAVEGWLRAVGRLPLNVRFLIEGEEETGSEGLEPFLARHASMLAADVAVLADTGNFDVGHPALTYQLRGICQVDVAVRCLKQPVHSGFWGGPVPDAVRILTELIAGLEAKDGGLAVPGLYARVATTGKKQLRRMRALPFDEGKFRASAAMKPGTRLVGEQAYSVWERLWTRPSLTVIALEAQKVQGSANQILDAARARLSLRTVPDMDAATAGRLLVKKLTADPPAGAKVTARVTGSARWWTTDPEGPAFEAARRALAAAFGRDAAMIGAGGSIGFVQPFSDALGGVPCLLMGVEDPSSAIHSENESLHLGDFVRGMRAAVHLYDELSRAPLARSERNATVRTRRVSVGTASRRRPTRRAAPARQPARSRG
jgi:acetylornithine deacetylase/succinyl-diaminopimelate desuccinylase-like protein